MDIPGSLHPGIFNDAIKLLNNSKQYILIIDGKKIAPALGSDEIGDINLWGLEKPSIEERKPQRNNDMAFIKCIENSITCDLHNSATFKLPSVLSLMTSYLRDICDTELGHRRLLKILYTLQENNPDTKGYTLGIKGIKGYIYTLMEWINLALENNKQLCKLMCDMKSTQSDFCDRDIVNMSQQSNVRFLLEPQEMPQHINLKHSPQFVKQRTEEWFRMHKKVLLQLVLLILLLGCIQ